MGFFDALRRALTGDRTPPGPKPLHPGLADAWGLDDDEESGIPTPPSDLTADASLYDRKNWQKKLKLILDELPESQPRWAELMTEARALHLDPDWVKQCQVEEFRLLIRRAVADRLFTEAEYRKLDLARYLIGMSEADAESALQSIVAEAEQFFGKPVKKE